VSSPSRVRGAPSEHIWQRTSVSRSQFAALYRAPLERYAELVQQFPPRKATTTPIPGACWITDLEPASRL